MSPKKISQILALIDISLGNLKLAKEQILALSGDQGMDVEELTTIAPRRPVNSEEYDALEVVEGVFDGEMMIGDNGKQYPVPPNYASKTQLIIGDRMKRILTSVRETFKLIKPANRDRVVGRFNIQGEDYVVKVKEIAHPVRILKASATFAMKNLGLQPGDKVAIIIPKDADPTWGALSSVVTGAGASSDLNASTYAAGNLDAPSTKPSSPASGFDSDYL